MTNASHQVASAPSLSHKQILEVMSGLLLGLFVAILSSTIVTNALPVIMTDLEGGQSAYTWTVTAALLATTAATPIWSKLADLFDKKLLVQIALVLFVVASAVAGLAQNIPTLITMRVFQGIGGGGLIALTQVIIAYMVPPRERGRYSGYIGATFGLATVAGPLIGGVIVEQLSWHYCFFVGIPFAVIAFVVLRTTLGLPVAKRQVHIDYWGAFLITAAVSDLLIWVSLAGHDFAWISRTSIAMLLGGVLLLGLALFAESKAAEPIIPLRLFSNPTIALATVAAVFVGVSMFGATIYLGQYFQLARGDSPTRAGLMTIPFILALVLSSTISGRVITKTGLWKRFLVLGSFLIAAGLMAMSTIGYNTAYWHVALFMMLLGTGLGMSMQNLVLAAQNSVEPAELGVASGSVAFFRSLGGAMGVALLGALLNHEVKQRIQEGVVSLKIESSTTAGLSFEKIPNLSALTPEVSRIVQDAYGEAVGHIFLAAAPFAVLAFIAVLFIKEVPLRASNARAFASDGAKQRLGESAR